VTNPLISIVIPTRNRPDTLAVCLRAMRHHVSPDIEIVVQDNSTNPDSIEVVEVAAKLDSRIRYARAPYPTSQRHNFELGLAAATGDYMSIIGDDDGYSIGSLDWLARQLRRKPVDAVRWNLLHYVWPSLSQDGVGFMDLYPTLTFGGFSIEPGTALASKVIRTEMNGSWENILVYHGMISRNVYDRMKSITNGVFFRYPMPDVYAHNVIPFFCDTYLQVNDIVSIYGVSGHSAGASWTRSRSKEGEASHEGNRWMTESVVDEVAQKLPWQPDIRTLRYHDFAAFKVAESFGMLGGQTADQEVWTRAIIAELQMNPTQLAPWMTAKPKAPFDAEIISRVQSAFAAKHTAVPAAGTNKKAVDKRIPSLRIGAVQADLPDDVEGAMLALAKVTSAETSRFEYKNAPEHGPVADIMRKSSQIVRRLAPALTSKVLNSRYMPKPLWRYLKTQQRGANWRMRETHVLIGKLDEEYQDKTRDRS
jgi:hypothetical protein